jgi:hypothetical protein
MQLSITLCKFLCRCLGDLNSISNGANRKGGIPLAFSSTGSLGNSINTNNLIDLGFRGKSFTYFNQCRDSQEVCLEAANLKRVRKGLLVYWLHKKALL